MKYKITRDIRIEGRHKAAGLYDDFMTFNDINSLMAANAIEVISDVVKPIQQQKTLSLATRKNITASVAVVLTCHTPYLGVLPNQIKAIDKQTHKANEKFLVLDGCEYTPTAGWTVIKGEWKEPNPGRNLATIKATSDWIIYADADDEMNPQFLEAMASAASMANVKTGFIYADINRQTSSIEKLPASISYTDQLCRNYVSASSCWRRHAVIEAGGCPEINDHYDDWVLANKLLSRKWEAEYQGEIPIDCYPEQNRNLPHRSKDPCIINKWNHKTYTIVSLLAGRINCFPQWLDYLQKEDKPHHVKLLIVDNSHNDEFHKLIWDSALTLKGYESIEIRKCSLKLSEVAPINRWHAWGSRHLHVSRIYSEILPLVSTDFTLFLEDDVIPEPGAFKKLIAGMELRRMIAGISAVYPSRQLTTDSSIRIVGAPPDEYWHNCYTMDDLPKDGKTLKEVGFIAGGFSLWRTGVILKSLPLCWDALGTILRGWDTRLSLQARQMGWQLFIDPGLICKHLINEDKNMIETIKDIAIEGKHCPKGTQIECKEEEKLVIMGVAVKVEEPATVQKILTVEQVKTKTTKRRKR